MTSPWSIPIFTNITLPTDAGPGESRIVIGPDLPPPLDTFTWNAGNNHYTGGIIFYGDGDDTTYTYLCNAVDITAAPGNGIVHMGQVASGFVQIDANGDPRVQAWEYDIGSGTFIHRFDSDTFRAERVTAPGASNKIEINFGQILMETINAAITIQALGAAGSLGIFSNNTILMTATNNLGINSNLGKITINAAGAGGDMDVLAQDLLRVISSNVLQLISANDAFLTSQAGSTFIQGQVNTAISAATGDVTLTANDDILLTATDLINFDGRIGIGPARVAYIPYVPQQARCNANTLAGVAQTLVPGTVINFTAEGTADVFIFTGTWDLLPNVAPTSLFVGTLFVDGVQQGGTATWQTGVVTQRNTITQTWQITGLAAGAHTADIRGASAVANQYLMVNTNSNLQIDPRYRKT